jgi:hypothetical protein
MLPNTVPLQTEITGEQKHWLEVIAIEIESDAVY